MSYKLIFLTVLFTFLALLFGLSQAQEEEKPQVSSVWIDELSSDLAEMVSYARKSVAEKEFRHAVDVYQGLIEKSRTDKECKSRVVHRGESVYLPLAKYCYGEILSLPEEGKQVYSILYAAKAERALGEAIQAREMFKLESVASDYLLTEAGKKALLCIADICMENSNFAVALRNLDKVAEYHYQGKAEPALLVLKRAACYLRLGEAALARKMVEGVISGASKSLLSSTEAALAERLLAELKDTGKQQQQQSINLFYDSYIHLEEEPDISIVGRRKGTEPDTRDWQFRIDRSAGGGERYVPGFAIGSQSGYDLFPVASGDLVFLTDSARVFAICVRGGKIRWREPSQEALTTIGAPMGLAESEGVVYAVLRNANALTGFGSRGQVESPVKALTDLYAFKADGAGSNPPLWSTTEMREGTLLGNITFTSIPLVEGKRIYLGGVEVIGQDMNYFVVCVTTDGMVLWKTRICVTKYTSGWSVASGFEFSALAAHHGSVIYCSNVGVLACLSFAGELEWLYKYPTSQSPAEASPFVQRAVSPWGWQVNAPIVWCGALGGKVYEVLVVAPQDSDCLLAFSLRDKRLLWLEPRNGHTNVMGPRGDVICIYGGAAELETGKIGVRAIRIPNGKIMWEVALDDMPAGKGVMTDRAIYIPCTKGLVKIEEVQVAPPDIPAKVTQSVEWYSFGEERPKEEARRPETTEEQVLRARIMAIRRGLQPAPSPVEETTAMGSLLFFGDRIITCGFSYTNSFKRADNK